MVFTNILVVCVGNICRSPMAEALLKEKFPNKTISSAGLEGLVGRPADPMAVECMADIGFDISGHIARRLDGEMLMRADLVLAMTTQQVHTIEERWSFSKGKVFNLCHWNGSGVQDPYRKEKFVFSSVRDLIQSGVQDWASHL